MDGKIKRLHYGDVMIELPYEIECDKKVFKLYSMEQQMIAMLWYAIKNIMGEIVKMKENKDDSIGRQEVINAIEHIDTEQSTEVQDILQFLDEHLHPIVSPEHWSVYSELYDMVSMLPSAETKKGQWIFTRYYVWECSECGKNPTKGMGYVQRKSELFRYCPNCGAEMEVAE